VRRIQHSNGWLESAPVIETSGQKKEGKKILALPSAHSVLGLFAFSLWDARTTT
jgi:hypothetical protein